MLTEPSDGHLHQSGYRGRRSAGPKSAPIQERRAALFFSFKANGRVVPSARPERGLLRVEVAAADDDRNDMDPGPTGRDAVAAPNSFADLVAGARTTTPRVETAPVPAQHDGGGIELSPCRRRVLGIRVCCHH